MADSRLERIVQYMVAQLDAEGKPDGLLVDRQRTLPLEVGHLPAAVVYLLKEEAAKVQGRSTVTRAVARIRVELRVEGEPTDKELDPLRQWTMAQVMDDFSMSGLAKEVEYVGSQWKQEAGDFVIGGVAMDFDVTYYHPVNDITG